METREDILKELKEIAPQLVSLEKVNLYQLPESYFLNFKNMMLEQVKPVDIKQELQVLAPALLKLEKPLRVEVPAAYFSAFSARLLNKVRGDEVAKELAAVAPRLSAIEKVNMLVAPAHYFSAFPARVLRDIQAQQQAPVADAKNRLQGMNELLDNLINLIFKPKYTFAFAGLATTVIMGVLMFVKIQQCDDLECRFAQLSSEEINSYLDNKSDAYADEVFEMNLDTKGLTGNPNINSVHAYNDALNEVDDKALNEAIAD